MRRSRGKRRTQYVSFHKKDKVLLESVSIPRSHSSEKASAVLSPRTHFYFFCKTWQEESFRETRAVLDNIAMLNRSGRRPARRNGTFALPFGLKLRVLVRPARCRPLRQAGRLPLPDGSVKTRQPLARLKRRWIMPQGDVRWREFRLLAADSANTLRLLPECNLSIGVGAYSERTLRAQ